LIVVKGRVETVEKEARKGREDHGSGSILVVVVEEKIEKDRNSAVV
jgi:hypothetical protein